MSPATGAASSAIRRNRAHGETLRIESPKLRAQSRGHRRFLAAPLAAALETRDFNPTRSPPRPKYSPTRSENSQTRSCGTHPTANWRIETSLIRTASHCCTISHWHDAKLGRGVVFRPTFVACVRNEDNDEDSADEETSSSTTTRKRRMEEKKEEE